MYKHFKQTNYLIHFFADQMAKLSNNLNSRRKFYLFSFYHRHLWCRLEIWRFEIWDLIFYYFFEVHISINKGNKVITHLIQWLVAIFDAFGAFKALKHWARLWVSAMLLHALYGFLFALKSRWLPMRSCAFVADSIILVKLFTSYDI